MLARRKRAELLELLRPCFARTEPWLQAGKYAAAVTSDLRRRNGWTIAERSGDRTPDRTQRLLNRAVWDAFAAMAVVRRFAVAGLDEAARRAGQRGLAVVAVDETGQVKDDPTHRPRSGAPAHPSALARRRRALAGLAAPPPSPAQPVTTSAPASSATRSPWSDSEWLLPYQGLFMSRSA